MAGVHEGGCACGGVRYRVTGEPMVTPACYCMVCQRVTGAAVSVTLARAPNVRLISRGTLDDPGWPPIKLHQFIRSAQSGVVFPPHIDCFEAGFRKLDGAPNEGQRFPRATMSLGPGRARQAV